MRWRFVRISLSARIFLQELSIFFGLTNFNLSPFSFCLSTASLISPSVVSPSSHVSSGSGISLRPNNNKFVCVVSANATAISAVTPRAPPVTITTSFASKALALFDWLISVVSSSSVFRCSLIIPTSNGPSNKHSLTMLFARSSILSLFWISMALQETSGHSLSAVLIRPATPPETGQASPTPFKPNCPPSCVTQVRIAASDLPEARNNLLARWTSIKLSFINVWSGFAGVSMIKPASIDSGSASSVTIFGFRSFCLSDSQIAWVNSGASPVTHTVASFANDIVSCCVFKGTTVKTCLSIVATVSVAIVSEFVSGEAVSVVTGTGELTSIWSIICCKVCNVPRSSDLTVGISGMRSCNAESISTRLIESIPRSASRFISRFNMSAG